MRLRLLAALMIVSPAGVAAQLHPAVVEAREAFEGLDYARAIELAEAALGSGLAEADMAASWISGIIAVHAYQLSLMDPKAAQEVYSAGPDTLVSSSYNPAGAKVETVR